MMVPTVVILWALSLAALLAGAISDFRARIIPNYIVGIIAGCGVMLRLATQLRVLGLSLGIAVALLLAFGLLSHRGFIGGGDAKLLAAVSLLVTPGRIAGLYLAIAVAGGLLSCAYLVTHLMSSRAAPRPGASPAPASVRRDGSRRALILHMTRSRSIPYGLAVFAGTASIAISEVTLWLHAMF